MIIPLAREAEIALLLTEKVIMPIEYADFANVFLKESIKMLLERTDINKYAIKLAKGKKSLYELMYSLGQVKVDILKIYMKINLANNFIQFFKSPIAALVLFV